MVDPQDGSSWSTIWAAWEVFRGIGEVVLGAATAIWMMSRRKVRMQDRLEDAHHQIGEVRSDISELRSHVDDRFRSRDAQRSEDQKRLERQISEDSERRDRQRSEDIERTDKRFNGIDAHLQGIQATMGSIYSHLIQGARGKGGPNG